MPGVALVGNILGAVVVLLILGFVVAFGVMYFGEKNREMAQNNFIALANVVEGLSKRGNLVDIQRNFPFYLPSDFVIVGFNKGWDNSVVTDRCEDEAVRKPTRRDGTEGTKCENSACICLFTNNDDLMKKNGDYNVELIECRSLEDVDYIIAPFLDKGLGEMYEYPVHIWKNLGGKKINGLYRYASFTYGFRNGYSFFYLYGQCDNYYWDRDIGSRKLYVEKIVDNGINYIFITSELHPEGGGKTILDDRKEQMISKYGEK